MLKLNADKMLPIWLGSQLQLTQFTPTKFTVTSSVVETDSKATVRILYIVSYRNHDTPILFLQASSAARAKC